MKKVIDKLSWIPVRDRTILFARSRGQELFYCPGGKREAGETDEQALLREIREETGVILDPATMRHWHTFIGPSVAAPDIDVKLTCYDAVGDREPVAMSEIEELAWFTTADGDRTTPMGRKILEWFAGRDLID